MDINLVKYIKNMFAMEATPIWTSDYNGALFYDKTIKKWVVGNNIGFQILDRETTTLSGITPVYWIDPFEYPTNEIIRNNYVSTGVPITEFKNVKSVIIDIATNWGHGTFTGLRNIEFKLKSMLIPITSTNAVIYGDKYTDNFEADNCFLTEGGPEIKTGDWSGTGWLVSGSTNKRVICVFNTPQTFDQIIINNTHTSGIAGVFYTNAGARGVKIKISTDPITLLVYNAPVVNSIEIFNGEFERHIEFDVADDKILILTPVLNYNLVNTDLMVESESTLKTYGNYSLKCVASISSINKYILKQFLPVIETNNFSYLKFDTMSSRVGNNISINLANNLQIKSVILDIANNYGSGSYVGIRSVDFYNKSSKIDTSGVAFFTALATSSNGLGYTPDLTFNTSLSKIDGYTHMQWLSAGNNTTNQRLICIFNTIIEFDTVIIINSHYIGTETNAGAKSVKIYTSTDSITSTIYNESIPHATLIFDGIFAQHTSANVEDPQNLTLLNMLENVTTKTITHYTLDTWQTEYVDLTAVSGTTNTITFNILNVDLENTFYIDNMYLEL